MPDGAPIPAPPPIGAGIPGALIPEPLVPDEPLKPASPFIDGLPMAAAPEPSLPLPVFASFPTGPAGGDEPAGLEPIIPGPLLMPPVPPDIPLLCAKAEPANRLADNNNANDRFFMIAPR